VALPNSLGVSRRRRGEAAPVFLHKNATLTERVADLPDAVDLASRPNSTTQPPSNLAYRQEYVLDAQAFLKSLAQPL
jgi:hypothetical protein